MPTDYKMIGADGQEYPGTLEELRQWAGDGRMGPETLVWSGEDSRWRRASEWPELRWDLPQPMEAPPVIPGLPVAGFIPRLAAYVFDAMVLQMILFVVILPWRAEFKALFDLAWSQYDLNRDAPPDLLPVLKAQLAFFAVYTPVSLIYWVGFNGRYGATPGKNLVGIRIVDLDGAPIGYRRAFRRYCAEVVSMLPLGMGYLMVAFSPTKQALHDILAGTQVVFRRIL
jgi:uncharacterized RDD family membrane protein YckC